MVIKIYSMVATLGSKYCPMKESGADGCCHAGTIHPATQGRPPPRPTRKGRMAIFGATRLASLLPDAPRGHPPLLTEALSPMSGALWGFLDFFSFQSLPAYNYRVVSSKKCINT